MGQRALTKTSRCRGHRTVGAGPGRERPPRRPAAGRRTGRRRCPGRQTLRANEDRSIGSSCIEARRARIEGSSAGEREQWSTHRWGRSGRRRLRRAASAETAGERYRNRDGMGEGSRRELRAREMGMGMGDGVLWWWGVWRLASPEAGEAEMDGSRGRGAVRAVDLRRPETTGIAGLGRTC